MASASDRPLLGLCRSGLRLYGKIHYAHRPLDRREGTKRREGEKEEMREEDQGHRADADDYTGLATAAYECEGIIKPRLTPVIISIVRL